MPILLESSVPGCMFPSPQSIAGNGCTECASTEELKRELQTLTTLLQDAVKTLNFNLDVIVK